MGATYDAATRSYSIGLLLLVATALAAFVFTALVLRGPSKTVQAVKA
jgi:NNP family nitrate/nitrite transporter-like MFS transporter